MQVCKCGKTKIIMRCWLVKVNDWINALWILTYRERGKRNAESGHWTCKSMNTCVNTCFGKKVRVQGCMAAATLIPLFPSHPRFCLLFPLSSHSTIRLLLLLLQFNGPAKAVSHHSQISPVFTCCSHFLCHFPAPSLSSPVRNFTFPHRSSASRRLSPSFHFPPLFPTGCHKVFVWRQRKWEWGEWHEAGHNQMGRPSPSFVPCLSKKDPFRALPRLPHPSPIWRLLSMTQRQEKNWNFAEKSKESCRDMCINWRRRGIPNNTKSQNHRTTNLKMNKSNSLISFCMVRFILRMRRRRWHETRTGFE